MNTTLEATTYQVDTTKSKLGWTGKKLIGSGHTGFIQLAEGKLVFEGQELASARFIIDMNTLTCTDLEDAGYNEKLIGHLKSEDFFGTAQHGTAAVEVKEAVYLGEHRYQVRAGLTIKGVTEEIGFEAEIRKNSERLTATAHIAVDRTLFGIRYGSGSFFDNLGDKTIKNEFEIDLQLVAQR